MRTATLIKHNLTYYWRTNLAVVLGVATAVAVLSGALLVGDSVRASLRSLFLNRLGHTDHVLSSTGMFREDLVGRLRAHDQFGANFSAACPLIITEGLVTHQESGRRGGGVQVYGVDDRFWQFHAGGQATEAIGEREVLVSPSLADELGSKPGDTLLVRIEKAAAIPAESLQGRKDDVGRTIRLSVRDTLSVSALGEFSLRPQQGPARAVFVSLKRLQKDLEQTGRVNTLLLSAREGSNPEQAQVSLGEAVKQTALPEDLGVKVRILEGQECLSVETESALINDDLSREVRDLATAEGWRTTSILTYLANSIRSARGDIPYSVITAFDQEGFNNLGQPVTASSDPPPIVLNKWAADDLGVKPGDRVDLEYYVWKQEGRLDTEKAVFRLAGIVPISGAAADRNLTPDYPGITGTESLSDWDPPFPVDLGRIRPRDEQYWDQYRTTPKAFIPLEVGQRLWQSRFGNLTAIRIFPPVHRSITSDPQLSLQSADSVFTGMLIQRLDPVQMGLSGHAVRSQGLAASRGATDFGEYFVYFSFFLVVSALMLTAMFFKLGVEQRLKEIGLLRAVGFPAASIRNIFLKEGVALAAAGAVVGLAGAVAYGYLMIYGLRTWWVGAVGTRELALHVSPTSLAIGAVGAVLTALGCIAWTLRRLAPASPRSLLAGSYDKGAAVGTETSRRFLAGLVSLRTAAAGLAILGVALLVGARAGLVGQVAGFFGAGSSLLIALFCYQSAWLRQDKRRLLGGNGWWAVSRLGLRNTSYRPGRSVLCIALIASATFVIVAVDAFRRTDTGSLLDRRSGTGGYTLLAESVLPLYHDPDTAEGREALNLFNEGGVSLDAVSFTRFRVRPGDDASCLNLYQPRNPRILAPAGDFINSGRFAFQDSLAASEQEKNNPWLLLEKEEPEGVVPIVADANSITYVLHLELGDEFLLSRSGAKPVRLRLVAALKDSLLQGELLMSEENFLRLFPDQEGYRFFLLDAPAETAAAVAANLEEQLSDFGLDVQSAGERLASYHRVENTYLSTFQTLGGLGLVLGTLGLATVLLRNVLERRRELALLRAIGYKPRHFALMVIAENAMLLVCGLATGTLCALLAIAPAFFARGGGLPTLSLGALLIGVMVTGLLASVLATAAALRSPLLQSLRAE